MIDLPAPLAPVDCDCTDLDGFMLNVERLMASELVALSSHEIIAAALFVWCRAWKQRPAASLPDDDRVIAAFSRLPIAKFKRHRQEIMRGFVKCSDGRLYHKTLAAEAVRAFEKKLAFQRKRDTDNERLKKWRGDRKTTEGAWLELRSAVFKRDGNKCTKCGATEDLHCDHVIEAGDGGVTEMHNLTTLCRSCHGRKTALHRHRCSGDEMHFVAEGQGRDRDGTVREVVPIAEAIGRQTADILEFAGKPDWWPKRDRYGRVISAVDDKIIYDTGKAVLGKSAGGQINKLLQTNKYKYDRRAALELILRADDASEAAPWFAAALRKAQIDEPEMSMHEKFPEQEYRA